MGLEYYMLRNSTGLTKYPSQWDEEFAVASFKNFIANNEMIDYLLQNKLVNQKRAPIKLIKEAWRVKEY